MVIAGGGSFPPHTMLMTTALVLLVGLAAQGLAHRLGLPSLLFLMVCGMALGPDGLDWVRPRVYGAALAPLLALCVAVIVFEGAQLIDTRHLRHCSRAVLALVSVGVLTTSLGATALAAGLFGWPLDVALLFGVLVSVTGPTVLTPILRRLDVSAPLKATLMGEGVFADAVCVLAAGSVFGLVTAAHGLQGGGLLMWAWHLAIGAGVGLGVALVGRFVLARSARLPAEFVRWGALGSALFAYACADWLAPDSGIMAVAVAGLTFGVLGLPRPEEVLRLESDLAMSCLSMVFILIAAGLPFQLLTEAGWRGALLVFGLMFLVRPLGVWLSTWRSPLARRERVFMAFFAPRGVVAISAAAYFGTELQAAGVAGGRHLTGLVFLVVLVTVALQGTGAPWLASRLRITGPPED